VKPCRACAPLLAALGCAALGCAGSERGPSFATSESFPASPRKPPSFAAEPDAAPRATAGALSSEDDAADTRRLLVPLDSEAARQVVSRFFVAVLLESSRDLSPLLAAQALVVSEGNRQPAAAVWRARFAQLDYTGLAGRIVAAPQTLHTYTFGSAARAKRDGVPPPLSAAEVVIVARPGLSWAGKTRLFGDELAFRLRPKADEPRYEIAEIVEDFRLP
jgi:hypothetical protein